MATGTLTHKESDGRAVTVALTASVEKGQVAYVSSFLGITNRSGDSGDNVALSIAQEEYQFTVPASLSVSIGDIVYIDTAQVTGHTPDDAGYATTAGSGLIRLFKATSTKDANNMVTGILLTGAHLS